MSWLASAWAGLKALLGISSAATEKIADAAEDKRAADDLGASARTRAEAEEAARAAGLPVDRADSENISQPASSAIRRVPR